ncbi:MAG TPA: NUDIX-like domain-containing protein [Longimicrobium sp.]|jgi:NADH pyrophosphatase NudC (nudix superfamily)
MPNDHIFSGGLNRAAEHRRNAAWIADRLGDPGTRFTPVWEHRSLFAFGESRAAWLTPMEAAPLLASSFPIFLGEVGGAAYFAVPVDEAAATTVVGIGEWGDLRKHAIAMEPGEASLLAYARGWRTGTRATRSAACAAPRPRCATRGTFAGARARNAPPSTSPAPTRR